VQVKAAKPSALVFASSSEVEITRSYDDYPHLLPSNQTKSAPADGVHLAAIAIGANLGDRFHNLEYALRLLETPQELLEGGSSAFVRVVNTGFMYESAPMYVTDQPEFANSACLVRS
jgi:dihydroneopterin aldolase / 2-amino-4-hydroxy-6-hydroxymethyldihydropteridine diphosphokinase / dihydropteroate synthase